LSQFCGCDQVYTLLKAKASFGRFLNFKEIRSLPMPFRYSLSLLAFLILSSLSACASTVTESSTPPPYPTSTPYPISTPYPTPTPFGEAFLRELLNRVKADDTIPAIGKKVAIALVGQEPTYVFKQNQGLVLQFNLPNVPEEPELKKTVVLLMGTGVAVAGEHNIPLSGIEVVFHLKEGEPWLALALVPPWDVANDLRLAPLHPDYLKRLQEAGLITPTPEPTY
jgi:hypothetical protein